MGLCDWYDQGGWLIANKGISEMGEKKNDPQKHWIPEN